MHAKVGPVTQVRGRNSVTPWGRKGELGVQPSSCLKILS